MSRRLLPLFVIGPLAIIIAGISWMAKDRDGSIGIAVEFNNHAACAHVAHSNGWFKGEGLELLPLFQVYESGAAIAAAFARGDIQVGYLGLTAAIMAYARGVPIKVVAGVHQYGYGLVARPELKGIEDLKGKTVGCLREGTVTDLLLNRMIDRYQLKEIKIRRMSPSQEVIGLFAGRLDAAFLPEQHATMADSMGFPMLLTSEDLWPDMQGDVLAVREKLLEDNPELVEKLVKITQRATVWIHEYPYDAAKIIATRLRVAGEETPLVEEEGLTANLEITPEIMIRSMERVIYTTDINPSVVQDMMEYMVKLGYIKEGIEASDILDLRYLSGT